MDRWDFLFLIVVTTHVFIAPYSKVEESFNLQAIHDILFHKTNIDNYDHLEFPGVVPRTFLGALGVSIVAFPGNELLSHLGISKINSQILVRFLLGFFVVLSFSRLRKKISQEWGNDVGVFLMVITSVQFHIPFYASRTLPNTFALILVNEVYTAWLSKKNTRVIFLLAFTTLVFRSEVILLAGPIALVGLIERRFTFLELLKYGILYGLLSLGTTIAVDSLFWKRLIWPEGEVFYFNTFKNMSHNYGVSPYYWYFLIAIPKVLSVTASFIIYAVFIDLQEKLSFLRKFTLLPINFTFLVLYSFLPHKELRFIFYVFPVLNTVSAYGAAKLYRHGQKMQFLRAFVALVLISTLMVSCIVFLWASANNYPGGVAFSKFHKIVPSDEKVKVHIGVLPAMTGVSRFGELHSSWGYFKNETLTPEEINQEFTHLITSNRTFIDDTITWEILDVADGFKRFSLKFPPKMETEPQVYILNRK